MVGLGNLRAVSVLLVFFFLLLFSLTLLLGPGHLLSWRVTLFVFCASKAYLISHYQTRFPFYATQVYAGVVWGSQIVQDAFRRLRRASRVLQERPRRPQDVPRRPLDAPRRVKDAEPPRITQEYSQEYSRTKKKLNSNSDDASDHFLSAKHLHTRPSSCSFIRFYIDLP